MKLSLPSALAMISRMVLRCDAPHLRARLFFTAILLILGPVASVLAPVVLGTAVNQLTTAAGSQTLSTSFVLGALMYVVLATVSSCAPYIRDIVFARVSESTSARASIDAFKHALGQSLDFHLTKQTGAVSRVIERGVRAIDKLLRGVAFHLGPTAIEFTLALIVMVTQLSWQFAAIALLGVSIYLSLTHYATRWRLTYGRRLAEADANAAGLAIDTLIGVETVKSFGAEERMVHSYSRSMQKYVDASVAANISLNLLSTAQHTVMRLALALIVVMAGVAVTKNQLQVGEVLTAILLLRGLFYPLGMLGYSYREIQQSIIDMENLVELNSTRPTVQDPPVPLPLPETNRRGAAITFQDVSVRYDSRTSGGLRNVTFHIPPGATFALVGPSGAGKTTVVRLLTRMLDPQHGSVRLDGVDLRQVQQSELRGVVAVVPQDVTLLSDSLFANIAFGRPDAHMSEVRSAADAAELGAFIDSLPMGLETLVGERGMKLSGGERQRVGIARALLTDPKVLILDEATSALDGPTEAAIQATLQKVRCGRTTLVVAHRLSTVVDADEILVLRDGGLTERGTHIALLAKKDLYARLWQHQTRDTRPSSSSAAHPNVATHSLGTALRYDADASRTPDSLR